MIRCDACDAPTANKDCEQNRAEAAWERQADGGCTRFNNQAAALRYK